MVECSNRSIPAGPESATLLCQTSSHTFRLLPVLNIVTILSAQSAVRPGHKSDWLLAKSNCSIPLRHQQKDGARMRNDSVFRTCSPVHACSHQYGHVNARVYGGLIPKIWERSIDSRGGPTSNETNRIRLSSPLSRRDESASRIQPSQRIHTGELPEDAHWPVCGSTGPARQLWYCGGGPGHSTALQPKPVAR
jgi:hypothetical protein